MIPDLTPELLRQLLDMPLPPVTPPPAVPELDRPLLRTLLRQIEHAVGRRGWDETPRLYLLYEIGRHQDGRWVDTEAAQFAAGIRTSSGVLDEPIIHGRYAAQMMVFDGAFEGNPVTCVANFAQSVAYGADRYTPPAVMRNTLRRDGAIGLAVTTESYGFRGLTREERDAIGDVPFADTPGAREGREVTAVTWDRCVEVVQHIRGGDITLLDDDTLGGKLALWLRLLCSAVLDDVPPANQILKRWPHGHREGSDAARKAAAADTDRPPPGH